MGVGRGCHVILKSVILYRLSSRFSRCFVKRFCTVPTIPLISKVPFPSADPSTFEASHKYIPASSWVTLAMVSTPPRTVPLTGSEPFNFRHVSFGDGEPLAIHVNSADSPIFTRDFRGVTVTLGASKNNKKFIFLE